MKIALLVGFTLLAAPLSQQAFADDDFAAHKTQALAKIDGHIQKLQEHKGCVSAASTKEAMAACHSAMKTWRESEQAQHAEHAQNLGEEVGDSQDATPRVRAAGGHGRSTSIVEREVVVQASFIPPATCLPSWRNSPASRITHPAASEAASTSIRAGKMRRMRRA